MGYEFRYVKPTEGLIVRDPRTKAMLPETGMNVPWIGPEGRYWRRQLKDKSIYISSPPIKQNNITPIIERKNKREVKENDII